MQAKQRAGGWQVLMRRNIKKSFLGVTDRARMHLILGQGCRILGCRLSMCAHWSSSLAEHGWGRETGAK